MQRRCSGGRRADDGLDWRFGNGGQNIAVLNSSVRTLLSLSLMDDRRDGETSRTSTPRSISTPRSPNTPSIPSSNLTRPLPVSTTAVLVPFIRVVPCLLSIVVRRPHVLVPTHHCWWIFLMDGERPRARRFKGDFAGSAGCLPPTPTTAQPKTRFCCRRCKTVERDQIGHRYGNMLSFVSNCRNPDMWLHVASSGAAALRYACHRGWGSTWFRVDWKMHNVCLRMLDQTRRIA